MVKVCLEVAAFSGEDVIMAVSTNDSGSTTYSSSLNCYTAEFVKCVDHINHAALMECHSHSFFSLVKELLQ